MRGSAVISAVASALALVVTIFPSLPEQHAVRTLGSPSVTTGILAGLSLSAHRLSPLSLAASLPFGALLCPGTIPAKLV